MGCNCSRVQNPKHVDVRSVYTIGNVLGSGAFGQVRSCVHKITLNSFAVKIMAKNPPSQGPQRRHSNVDFTHMFRNEVDVLKDLDHENIIKYHEFYEDQHFLYAIIDKCEGGELFQKISQKKKFYESDAAMICRQMLSSIQYLHSRNVVHRDIKAQNFLFKSANEDSSLVLIDFGMASKLEDDEIFLTRLCGSPHYVSPELVQRRYRFTVDLWAVGVVLYLMIYGKYPFEGSDRNSIMKKVSSRQPHFNEGPSDSLLDLLKSLLSKDLTKRPNADEALRHSWLSPENWRQADAEVPSAVVREFERKMTLEKDVSRERDFERKLSKLNDMYMRGVSPSNKLTTSYSSGKFGTMTGTDNRLTAELGSTGVEAASRGGARPSPIEECNDDAITDRLRDSVDDESSSDDDETSSYDDDDRSRQEDSSSASGERALCPTH